MAKFPIQHRSVLVICIQRTDRTRYTTMGVQQLILSHIHFNLELLSVISSTRMVAKGKIVFTHTYANNDNLHHMALKMVPLN